MTRPLLVEILKGVAVPLDHVLVVRAATPLDLEGCRRWVQRARPESLYLRPGESGGTNLATVVVVQEGEEVRPYYLTDPFPVVLYRLNAQDPTWTPPGIEGGA